MSCWLVQQTTLILFFLIVNYSKNKLEMTINTITLILKALQLLELRKLHKTIKGSFDDLENLSGISLSLNWQIVTYHLNCWWNSCLSDLTDYQNCDKFKSAVLWISPKPFSAIIGAEHFVSFYSVSFCAKK